MFFIRPSVGNNISIYVEKQQNNEERRTTTSSIAAPGK